MQPTCSCRSTISRPTGKSRTRSKERIVARSLRTGDALPSETDLARQFGVNRSTIREAIRELETHGLLGRERGASACASRFRSRAASVQA